MSIQRRTILLLYYQYPAVELLPRLTSEPCKLRHVLSQPLPPRDRVNPSGLVGDALVLEYNHAGL